MTNTQVNKLSGYNINIQRAIIFIYTSNEQFKSQIKKTSIHNNNSKEQDTQDLTK